MHQHARMYGYRSGTLAYTRLFTTRRLYFRFRDIHQSDEELRNYIIKNLAKSPSTFPIEYTYGLRTTRPGVLDAKKIDAVVPGKQIYPNYIALPQSTKKYEEILSLLHKTFKTNKDLSEKEFEKIGRRGVQIGPATAIALVELIKTKSKNIWRDNTIAEVMKKVAGKYRGRLTLRFRTAKRTVDKQGYLETGTLFGGDVTTAQAATIPTLWIMAVTTLPGSGAGNGRRFMYPTFIVPNRFPKLFMYNRGK